MLRLRLLLLSCAAIILGGLAPQTALAKFPSSVTAFGPGASFRVGQTVTASARAYGSSGVLPTGTIQFLVCGPFLEKAGCGSGGSNVGGPIATSIDGANAGLASSPGFRLTAVGYFCFVATYSGNAQLDPSKSAVDGSLGCFKVVDDARPTMTLRNPPSPVPAGDRLTLTVGISVAHAPPAGYTDVVSIGMCLDSNFQNPDPTCAKTVNWAYTAVPFPGPAGGQPITFNFPLLSRSRVCFRITSQGPQGGGFYDEAPSPPVHCTDITPAATTTTVTAAVTPSLVGSPITAVAETTSPFADDFGPRPRGEVAFSVCGPLPGANGCATGGTGIGSAELTRRTVTSPSFTPTAPGTFCFRAAFGGSEGWAPSSGGAPAGCVVVQRPTSVTDAPSRPSIAFGGTVTDSATVGSGGSAAPGQVAFFVCGPVAANGDCSSGGSAFGTAPLAGGRGSSAAFRPAGIGTFCFRAEYAGTRDFTAARTAGRSCVTVTPAPTTTTIAAGPDEFVFGTASPTTSARVIGGPVPPTGSVEFFACGPLSTPDGCQTGGSSLGTVPVDPAGAASGPAAEPSAPGYWCYRSEYSPTDARVAASNSTATACTQVLRQRVFIDAGSLSKTEGQPDPAPTFSLANGSVAGPVDAARFTGEPSCTVAPHAEGPGVKDGVISCTIGSLASSFYAFEARNSGALEILAKPAPPVEGGGGSGAAGNGGSGIGGAGNGAAGSGGGVGGAGGTGTGASGTAGAGEGAAGGGSAPAGAVTPAPGTSGPRSTLLPSNLVVFTSLRAKAGGLTVQLTVPGPGAVSIRVRSKTAKKVVATRSFAAKAAGKLTVKFTKGQLKKLLGASRGTKVKLSVSVAFTPTGGTRRTTAPKTATVKRG